MEKDFHLVVSCGNKTLQLDFFFFIANQTGFNKKYCKSVVAPCGGECWRPHKVCTEGKAVTRLFSSIFRIKIIGKGII